MALPPPPPPPAKRRELQGTAKKYTIRRSYVCHTSEIEQLPFPSQGESQGQPCRRLVCSKKCQLIPAGKRQTSRCRSPAFSAQVLPWSMKTFFSLSKVSSEAKINIKFLLDSQNLKPNSQLTTMSYYNKITVMCKCLTMC